MFGPMDLSRSGAKVQMQPDTGVTFNDVVGVDGAKLVRARTRPRARKPARRRRLPPRRTFARAAPPLSAAAGGSASAPARRASPPSPTPLVVFRLP
jgi:hypothetical protein